MKYEADIIFMPYNYVINSHILKNTKISLNSAVLIIDEGHNIVPAAEDAMSFKIDEKTLMKCFFEFDILFKF